MRKLFYLVMFLGLLSCSRTVYVPTTEVVKDIQYRDKLIRDSVYVKDSVFLYIQGDTVYKEKTITKEVLSLKSDTVFINKVDSVPYIQEVEVIKTETPKWAWWSLGISLGAVLLVLLRIFLKLRK